MAGSADLELEIRNLLLGKTSAREILDSLIIRLYDNQVSTESRREILAFAWNAGLYQQALEYFPELLRKRAVIPWAWFAELMAKAKMPATAEFCESLLKGARRQEQAADLTLSRSWDHKIPLLNEWRVDAEKTRNENLKLQRQLLFDKLAFYRNEQLAEEERRLLQLLKKMFPADPELHQHESEFVERWARHVIASHASDSDAWDRDTELQWGPEVLLAVAPMIDELKVIVERRPDLAYEVAVALLTMDLEAQAEGFIPRENAESASDWLKAEILLRSRRFVDCLDHITQLETRYGGDPETAFSITYIRAQAFFALGQTGRAIELLQTLVNIRPHYRSASSLLKQWQTGRQK